MAITQVGICNSALLRVGQAGITALNDGSAEAAICNQYVDDSLRVTLAAHPWMFAQKVAALSTAGGQTSHKFSYVYTLPADYIRAIAVLPSASAVPDQAQVPFEIYGNLLHTDEASAKLKYVWYESTYANFPIHFVDALSFRLSADISMPVTRDPEFTKQLIEMAKNALAAAIQIEEETSRVGGVKTAITSSVTTICNRALLHVTTKQINSINDASVEALYCRQFWDISRRALLAAHPWRFATKVSTLSVAGGQTSHKFTYVYSIPADHVRPIGIFPSSGSVADTIKIPFEIYGIYLHTDEGTAKYKYVYDETDATKFPDLFAEALALRLAADIATPLTKDPNLAKSLVEMYLAAAANAVMVEKETSLIGGTKTAITLSSTSICNRALSRVTDKQINNISDASLESTYCRQLYDPARQATLRAAPWNFATKYAALTQDTNATSNKYAYVYNLPTDCLRALEVLPGDTSVTDDNLVPFEIVGRQLHTDLDDADLKYIYDISDVTKFDSQFIDALVLRLASELALPLAKDPNYSRSLLMEFRMATAAARATDDNEGHKIPKFGRSYLNARA